MWDSRTQLANAMFEWIEAVYDRQRRHMTLDYMTPVDYDRTRLTAPAIAASQRNLDWLLNGRSPENYKSLNENQFFGTKGASPK